MKSRLAIIVFIMVMSFKMYGQDDDLYLLGAMLHVNIGGDKIRTSFGVELSYWNIAHFPYGVDGGIEFEKGKIRLYSQAETGVVLAGLSAGPLVEFRTKEKAIKAGFQGSIWAHYFLGFDFRIRRAGKETFVAPGAFLVVPLGLESTDGDDWDSDWDWD